MVVRSRRLGKRCGRTSVSHASRRTRSARASARPSLRCGGMMFEKDLLHGKRVLVTGGATGLGRSIGRRYVELGAELVICGRREAVLAETAAAFASELGATVETHVCD